LKLKWKLEKYFKNLNKTDSELSVTKFCDQSQWWQYRDIVVMWQ